MGQGTYFEKLFEDMQIAAFTKLFKERLWKPVANLRELCDSGANVEL
jgi:hypothetical protein